VIFYYNRYVEAGKCATLPFFVERWTREIIEKYKPLFENRPVEEIKKIYLEYNEIQKRIHKQQ